MKLISYKTNDKTQAGLLVDGKVYGLNYLDKALPDNMQDFFNGWEQYFPVAVAANQSIITNKNLQRVGINIHDVILLAPLPHPHSCRDGYAFRQHVAAARRNRNVPMIAEYDEFPIFYFTNHNSIQGPGAIKCMPDHFEKLDFELEVAIVICKHGKNIQADDADAYIGGLMTMNDMSARTLQLEEMKLNLGPAKGKDFATVIGPWMVTPDELATHEITPKKGHTGKAWNLKMDCSINKKMVSQGNLADMDWTFAEIIERVSYGADIYPGDIIGSGTVGTGCLLEINGTNRRNNPAYKDQWLKAGDIIEMNIEHVGLLTNIIVKEKSQYSILAKKK